MPPALRPYPAYKPSGVLWLGDVPAHWEIRRLKQLCSQSALYGANISATQYQEDGVRFLRTTDITDEGHLRPGGVCLSEELVRNYSLNDKDILISRSGTVGRSFLYQSKLHGPCAYAGYLVRFVPNELVLAEYIFQSTRTQAFDGFLRVMAISSTIENVNADKYANAHLTLPSLPRTSRHRALSRPRGPAPPAVCECEAETHCAAGGGEAGGDQPGRDPRRRSQRPPQALRRRVARRRARALGGDAATAGDCRPLRWTIWLRVEVVTLHRSGNPGSPPAEHWARRVQEFGRCIHCPFTLRYSWRPHGRTRRPAHRRSW